MPTCFFPWKPNAGAHLLPEAGAERTLEAVRCSAWFGGLRRSAGVPPQGIARLTEFSPPASLAIPWQARPRLAGQDSFESDPVLPVLTLPG
jgi:hypothetical protein